MIEESQIQPGSIRVRINNAIGYLEKIELKSDRWENGMDAEAWEFISVEDMHTAYRQLTEVIGLLTRAQERVVDKIIEFGPAKESC